MSRATWHLIASPWKLEGEEKRAAIDYLKSLDEPPRHLPGGWRAAWSFIRTSAHHFRHAKIRCAATARSTGKPCQRVPVKGSRFCINHGGRSRKKLDPCSPEGMARDERKARNAYAKEMREWLRELEAERPERPGPAQRFRVELILETFPQSAFRWPSLVDASRLLAEAYAAEQIGFGTLMQGFGVFRLGAVPARLAEMEGVDLQRLLPPEMPAGMP